MTIAQDQHQVSADAAAARVRSPREVWEQALRHHLDGDFDGFADMFAEDGVMEVPFAPEGFPRRMEGREEIRRTLSPFWTAAKNRGRRMIGYDPVVVHESRDPEVVIVEFDVHSEMAGEPYRMSYVHIVRARGGKIVSLRDHFDSALVSTRLKKIIS